MLIERFIVICYLNIDNKIIEKFKKQLSQHFPPSGEEIVSVLLKSLGTAPRVRMDVQIQSYVQ